MNSIMNSYVQWFFKKKPEQVEQKNTYSVTFPREVLIKLNAGYTNAFLEMNHDDHCTIVVPASIDRTDLLQVINYKTALELPKNVVSIASYLENKKRWDDVTMFLDILLEYPVKPTFDFMEILSMSDPGYFRFVKQDVLRRYGDFRIKGHVKDPYTDLVPLNKINVQPFRYNTSSNKVLYYNGIQVKRCRPDINGIHQFTKWFKSKFTSIPWFSADSKSGVCVAGGILTMAVHNKLEYEKDDCVQIKESDIDLFIVVDPSLPNHVRYAKAQLIHKQLIESMQDYDKTNIVITTGSDNFVTNVLLKLTENHYFKVQIIRRMFETPAHIVHGFDLSLCKLVYDGNTVMTTEAAIHDMTHGVMLLDQTKMSKSGEYRYIKYMKRYKYGLFIPGVPENILLHTMPGDRGDVGIKKIMYLMRRGDELDTETDYDDEQFKDIMHYTTKLRLNVAFYRDDEQSKFFTGAFNPVDINVYQGLLEYVNSIM